ncbi:hypothetical protein CYLTODRAFT_495295, partial [Cylindrobasidium torrendii FP15055 ss-10]
MAGLAPLPALPPPEATDTEMTDTGDSQERAPPTPSLRPTPTPILRTASMPAPKMAAVPAPDAEEDALWSSPAATATPTTPSAAKTRKPAASATKTHTTDWSQLAVSTPAKAFENLGLTTAPSGEKQAASISRFNDTFKKLVPLVEWALNQSRLNEDERAATARSLAKLRKDVEASGESRPLLTARRPEIGTEAAVAAVASARTDAIEAIRRESHDAYAQLEEFLGPALDELEAAKLKVAVEVPRPFILADDPKFRELWASVFNISKQMAANASNREMAAMREQIKELTTTVSTLKSTVEDLQRHTARGKDDVADILKTINSIRQDSALPPIPAPAAPPLVMPSITSSAPLPTDQGKWPRAMPQQAAPPAATASALSHMIATTSSYTPNPNKRYRVGPPSVMVGPFFNDKADTAREGARNLMDEVPDFSMDDLTRPTFWTSRRDGSGLRDLGLTFAETYRGEAFVRLVNSGTVNELKGLRAWHE